MNKKAITAVYWVIYGIVIGLCTFYFFYTFKNVPQNTEFVGQVFLDSYKDLQSSLKHMYYIKKSAEYSVYNAIYPFTKKGTYFNEPPCRYYSHDSGEYQLWKDVYKILLTEEFKEESCYPTERDLAINFALFLNDQLDKYFEIYPSAIIPKDNYDFNFNEKENSLEIVGIATQNILLTSENQNSVYSFNPSFKTEINYNFINKFNEYVEKTKEIEKKVVDCLKKGSYQPYDDDLMTCAVDKLKEEMPDIEKYGIIWETSAKDYTLLFNIKDDSFKNPYSEEELEIKYGIRFLDEFPPPATEIMTDINNKPLKKDGAWYLIWKINNASDVAEYSIYARKSEPTYIDENDLINKTVGRETEWEIKGLEGEYYFYIVAQDYNGNKAKEIITKRVMVPSIEEAQKEEVLDLSQ